MELSECLHQLNTWRPERLLSEWAPRPMRYRAITLCDLVGWSMMAGMRGRVLVRAGAAVAVAAMAGLGVYFAKVGLDEADKLASVIGVFLALVGPAMSVYGLVVGRRSGSVQQEASRASTSECVLRVDVPFIGGVGLGRLVGDPPVGLRAW
ncbi:hypothetical protein AB0C27_42545, partial [Nonomuraea sp. NPDC048882]|uniref:hypothetical protein n=1 Tax=Nonomuraea sp. NPDC048882 TaxID=3154347 RepID=UPI0034037B5A